MAWSGRIRGRDLPQADPELEFMFQVSLPRDLDIHPLKFSILVFEFLLGFAVTLVPDQVDEPRCFLLHSSVQSALELGV